VHLVIIGNGILALTTAFRVAARARPGDRIQIVGPSSRTGSATLAAAAMLHAFAEVEVGSLDHEVGRLHFDLSRRARDLWPAFGDALVRTVEPDAGVARLGYRLGTRVLDPGGDASLDIDAIVSVLAACHEPHERDRGGVSIPNEGSIDPRVVMSYLERALATFPHVEFIDAPVERLLARGGAIASAVLADGRVLDGSDFLLAAGATVTDLLARSGLDLPIQRVFYGIGVSLDLRCPDVRLAGCVRSASRDLTTGSYAVPHEAGRVLLGATSRVWHVPDTAVDPTTNALLLARAAERIDRGFSRAEIVRVNVGWRPTSQDTFPLVGRTSLANLVIASGTRRDGFHLSPLLSEHLCQVLLREHGDPRLAVFAPERAPIHALTREQALAQAVRYGLDRDEVERVHDRVGAVDWGIPTEMLEMYALGYASPAARAVRD
jgi:glycine/D-amino acid oxidase-like deaminating enzyme